MSEAETTQDARQGQEAVGRVPEGAPAASLAVVSEIRAVDDGPREVANGASPSRPPAPRAKRKERWVRIEDDAYEEFQMRIWVNYPQTVHAEMTSGDEDRARNALTQIVLEHNGWQDIDGREFPQPTSPDFWSGERAIPNELLRAIIALIQIEGSRLPNSLIEKSRNTNRT